MADTAVTIARSRVAPLTNEEASLGYNRKFRVLYSDIAYGTGSTDTVTMTLGSTPAKFLIDKALVNVKTAFAGTTALTVIVGTTTSTSALVTAQSVLTAGCLGQASGVHVLTNSTGTAAKSLVATFTNATGGSPSALTAGELDILLRVVDTDKLG